MVATTLVCDAGAAVLAPGTFSATGPCAPAGLPLALAGSVRRLAGLGPGRARRAAPGLLAALADPGVRTADVAALLEREPALRARLLRFVNSAFVALPGRVDSVQRAAVYTGPDAIRRWCQLLVVAGADRDGGALTRTLAVRARLCMRLCMRADTGDAGAAFTVGLLSGLDALLDRPLEPAVRALGLGAEEQAAILERSGVLGEALGCALAHERGGAACFAGLVAETAAALHAEAVTWAHEALCAMGP